MSQTDEFAARSLIARQAARGFPDVKNCSGGNSSDSGGNYQPENCPSP